MMVVVIMKRLDGMPHPKGDDFTQPKPITHQAAWALLHERPDICEKHIWNQITSE